MKTLLHPMFGILLLFALFIWARDTTWMAGASDTLPILAAVPVFIWLGIPWNMRRREREFFGPRAGLISLAVFVALAGVIASLTVLLAVSWTMLAVGWLATQLPQARHSGLFKLSVLLLLAFPWVTLDGQPIGWAFRLSSAWTTERIFAGLGFQTMREGTNLFLQGRPISVEAACSGLNTLQSMLIAGTVLNYLFLGHSKRYWWNLLLLPLFAWAANTVRIVMLCFTNVLVSAEFADGTFHKWGGWAVLFLMFCACCACFSWQQKRLLRKSALGAVSLEQARIAA